MINRKTTKSAGFSLVEIIIGVFIVGLIVVVINQIPNAINLVTSSQDDSKIREVAARKMEDIRLLGYDNLANGTTTINDSRLNELSNVSAFSVISDCPANVCTSGEQIKQVRITISWSENGGPKTYQLVTLVGKDGLK